MENVVNNAGPLETRFDGRNRDRFAAWFLIIALVSGLLIVFFTPPLCSPDENAHYMNAYAVSRGDLFPEVINGIPGRYVEGRVLSFQQQYAHKFSGNLSEKYSFSEQYFNGYLENSDTTPVFYGTDLNTINPIAYLPSGLFMMFGRLLGNLTSSNIIALPYNLLIFGRLGNLLFFSFVIYFALRNMKCFRRLTVLIAMLPISLFLGASVNYDAILISVCFLFISKAFNLLTESADKNVTKNDLLCILFCTFFLVGIKQAYATLLLILLAVPRKKYGSTKRMISYIAAVCIVGLIAYSPVLINKIICRDVVSAKAEYISAQTEYVKSHLALMPQVFFNTINKFKAFYLSSFFGKLGELDLNIPLPFEVLFYLLLFVVSVYEIVSTKLWDRPWKRVLPFAAVLISIIGTFGIMYIEWTPIPGIADGVGSDYISGVQGRYFIELFIPAVSVLCFGKWAQKRPVIKMEKTIDRLTYAWTAVCGLITPIFVVLRYW